MGGASLDNGYEDEWAEMVASLVIYARTNRHLQFTLLAPNNEPNITGEGIHVRSAEQYVTSLHLLAQLLDANGMSDVRFVAPDLSGGQTDFFSEIMPDPLVISKMAHFGIHSYSGDGNGSQGVYDFIVRAGYPDRTVWVTEYNVWCSDCEAGIQGTNDWDYALGTAQYLAGHLDNDVSAALVWEGYDSYYPHHANWSFWGLLAVDDINAVPKTWSPRHDFYTLAQFSKFVRPGARRIDVTWGSGLTTLQGFFHDASGQLALVGFNSAASSVTLTGTLTNLPALGSLDLYYTTRSNNLTYGITAVVTNNQFAVEVPPDSVFTLTGFDPAKTGLSIWLINPTNQARFEGPATVPIQARVLATTNAVESVEFFSGTNSLGVSTNPPYSIVWSNVPGGIYAVSASASNSLGNVVTSPTVQIAVVGPFSRINIRPDPAEIPPQALQQFTANATDDSGNPISNQPTFCWAVNGGGTITSNGIFTGVSGTGGPFIVQASASNLIGLASFLVTTNLAREGIGYTWYTLSSEFDNSPRAPVPAINDGDSNTDVLLLPGGGVEQSQNVYEAGGVIWNDPRAIDTVTWKNGSWSALGDGVFGADFVLQFSADGLTWTNAGPEWTLSPPYSYDSSSAANTLFRFSGQPVTALGLRCVGRVHTSDSSGSWGASATEVEAFPPASLPSPLPSLAIDVTTNRLLLSWNGWARDYVLEVSTNLGPAAIWTLATSAPQTSGERWETPLPIQSGPQFFRLRKP
jgi:O-glycosyl hydrolase